MQHAKTFFYIFFYQNTSIAKQKKNKPYTSIPKFTGSLKQFKSSNRDPAFQLKFKVWNKSAHHSKKKHNSACTKNNKVLKLKPITEAMPHHSFFSWSLNKCHARFIQRKEYKLNAETTKHSVCYLIFTRNRGKEYETRTCKKTKSP